MPDPRATTGGFFVLEVNGGNAGLIKRFSGLAMEADVVSDKAGPDDVQKKHVAATKWTPGKATIGISMGKEVAQWINAAFASGNAIGRGSLTSADSSNRPLYNWTFDDALITGLTVPALDGSSKEPGYFDLEFEAEQVRWSTGGADVRSRVGQRQRPWMCSNFRVEMGDLPCSRVASVDSFTWTCTLTQDDTGIRREPTKHPAKVTVPDIKLSISMADFGAWAEAARKWFVDGQHAEGNEMQGAIVFLDLNMKDELGRIDLANCGFRTFSLPDFEANSEKIARFDVELYVEKMAFTLNLTDVPR